MWAINITTENNETMTIFVANNAFDGIQPEIEEDQRIIILQNFVARFVKKQREMNPNATLPTLPLYLERMEFTSMADCRATIYLQPDENSVIKQTANLQALLLQSQSLLGEVGIKKWAIKERSEELPEFLTSKHAVVCAQALPPITTEDSRPTVMPLVGNEYTRAYMEALTFTLTADNSNPSDEFTAYQIATSIATFTQTTLEAIRDEHLDDIEEIDDIRTQYNIELDADKPNQYFRDKYHEEIRVLNDRFIKREAALIRNGKGIQYIDRLIGKHLAASYEYRAMIEAITVALHNAAKDYYLKIWAENQNNIQTLTTFRQEFNAFFGGLIIINDDFTLKPVTYTYQKILQQNLDATALQDLLSGLLNASYKNGAFAHLAKRLNALDGYFEPIAGQKFLKHKLSFAEHLSKIFKIYHDSRTELSDVPARHLIKIHDEIEAAKKKVDDKAIEIRQILRPNQPRRHGGFWQRNKATITSFIIGTMIAAAACVAIALAPITLPALAIAGIAVAAALVVIGISALVGRIIDKCRQPKEKKPLAPPGTDRVTQRLVDDFDEDLNDENPSHTQMSILIDVQKKVRPSLPSFKPGTTKSSQPAFMHSSSKPAQNTDKGKEEQRSTPENK